MTDAAEASAAERVHAADVVSSRVIVRRTIDEITTTEVFDDETSDVYGERDSCEAAIGSSLADARDGPQPTTMTGPMP